MPSGRDGGTVATVGALAVLAATLVGIAMLKRNAALAIAATETDEIKEEKDSTEQISDPSSSEVALIQRESFSLLSGTRSSLSTTAEKPLPCALLCGPFGSGKTTTLKHLLRDIRNQANFTCGAIVNDFSDLGVDVETVRLDQSSPDSLVFGVSEGCCCCAHSNPDSLATSLPNTINALRKRSDVDCLIVETNGLSEAAGARAHLSRLTRLDSVIGVIDGNAFPPQNWSRRDVESFAQTCDVIAVNKSDVCTAEDLGKAVALLRLSGARDIRTVSHGRIPLTAAFAVEVLGAAKGELGTSLAERKASTRYQLRRDIERMSIYVDHLTKSPTSAHLSGVEWRISELNTRPIDSLANLQDAVYKWNTGGTLQRAKGRVWLQHHRQVFDFQFSGRCRLQMSAVPTQSVIAKATRLAIVSSNIEEDADVIVRQQLFGVNDSLDDVLTRTSRLRSWLERNLMVSVLPFDADRTCVRFRLNCDTKFGFSEQDLAIRFGVDVDNVNREFHNRINSASGPLLVAFDGKDCFVSPGTLLDLDTAMNTLQTETEATVAIMFAVVKKYCRCE